LDLALIGLIGALLVGRLVFVLLHTGLFTENPRSAFAFWEGGLSFFGVLIGIFIAGLILTRVWKWPFFQVADFATLALLAATALVKTGAFLGGVEVGTRTFLPWGVIIPGLEGARHPTALYQAIFAAVLFLIMKNFYEENLKATEIRSGRVFLYSGFFLALGRAFFEFFRADSTYLGSLRSAQVASFLVATLSAFTLYYLGYRSLRKDFVGSLKFILSVNGRVLRKLKVWR